jgi:hypothetical protein
MFELSASLWQSIISTAHARREVATLRWLASRCHGCAGEPARIYTARLGSCFEALLLGSNRFFLWASSPWFWCLTMVICAAVAGWERD